VKHPNWDLQPAETKLFPEQRQHLIEMLKGVGWQRTGKDVFEAFFPILPMVPMELALVPEFGRGEEPRVHMLYRKDDWYEGSYMSGGYILRGETDREAIERILQKETNLELLDFEFIRNFNIQPRSGYVPNHQLSRFYHCRVKGNPKMGDFYLLTSLPKDTLDQHRKYVDHLRAFFLRRKIMQEKGIWFDGTRRASEWKWLCATLDPIRAKIFYKEVDTLDEALEHLKDWGGVGNHIFDDLGQQIV